MPYDEYPPDSSALGTKHAAEETWKRNLKRENSIISELMNGMYMLTYTC